MLQKSQTMTKLTMFINAYKLGSVSHLLDAPVFAEFKAHLNEQSRVQLREDDGEGDGEWVDEESDQGALEEIENDLKSESQAKSKSSGSSEGGSDSYGSSGADAEEDGECEEEEAGSASSGHHCKHSDGEEEFDWDTLDEEDDDEDDDEEVDSDDEDDDEDDEADDTEKSSGSSSHSSGDSSDESHEEHHSGEESGASSGPTSHHEAVDEDDGEDGEEIHEMAEEDSKHSGDDAQIYGSDFRSEQEATHGRGASSSGSEQEEIKSWPVYKSEILAVLEELKQHILSTMKQAQDDEVLAGVGLADFKLFIDLENRGLERDLAAQHATREDLAIQQKKNEWAITHCHAELQTTSDSEFAAKAEHEGTHVQYKENRAAKEAEREIYEYVLGLYEGRINAYNEPHYDSNDFDDLDVVSGTDGETDGENDGETDGEWIT